MLNTHVAFSFVGILVVWFFVNSRWYSVKECCFERFLEVYERVCCLWASGLIVARPHWLMYKQV